MSKKNPDSIEVNDPPEKKLHNIENRLATESAGREFGRESVRAALAIAALALVCVTVYWAWRASQGAHWLDAKEWLQVVLPVETGTLGSALGFYFGAHGGGRAI